MRAVGLHGIIDMILDEVNLYMHIIKDIVQPSRCDGSQMLEEDLSDARLQHTPLKHGISGESCQRY